MSKNNNLEHRKKLKNKTLSYYEIMTKNLGTKAQRVPEEVLSEICRELEILEERIKWNRKIYS